VRHENSQGGDTASDERPIDIGLPGRPVVVGEVLFDVFPDGGRVLGGAPFNVAWHLHAFGLRPLVLTRVGDDTLGNQILEAMSAWGMDRSGVQVDPEAPTGRVQVELDGGAPSFSILPDQAYDRLDGRAAADAMRDQELALVYHGSLIARSGVARAALQAIRTETRLRVFVDVNLREPWWDRTGVSDLLHGVRWVKLNDDELLRLTDADPDHPAPELEAAAAELAGRHELAQVVVTRGDRGALVWDRTRVMSGRSSQALEIVDTVGAGDAFAAVWIAGLLGGWTVGQTLSRALDFAAAFCTVRGATTDDRDLYRHELAKWQDR
jgi:fructokinase